MKTYLTLIISTIIFSQVHAGGKSVVNNNISPNNYYTPQQAISDVLSEPLTFVGREIPFKIDGPVAESDPRHCVMKNSRVYVVQVGCPKNTEMDIDVFSVEVFNRKGQSVEIYAETSDSTFSIAKVGPEFHGTWKVTLELTSPIVGEPNIKKFFDYYNAREESGSTRACSYGKTMTADDGPKLVCHEISESDAWRVSAEGFYSYPSNFRIREFFDAIKNVERK